MEKSTQTEYMEKSEDLSAMTSKNAVKDQKQSIYKKWRKKFKKN